MNPSITVYIMMGYLTLLVALGLISNRFFTGSSKDYFLASHSIGPFMLLMSVFGTTMTSFALVGSTGEAFVGGIAIFGKMASWSALIHAAVFFLIGIRLWAFGKRYGYVTQAQFFRDRYESDLLGTLLFIAIVAMIIPYLLVGLIGAGRVVAGLTSGAFPELFPNENLPTVQPGAIPPWVTNLVISCIVLTYIFFGGVRGTTWANTMQTIIFLITGFVTFFLISSKIGGFQEASQRVLESRPELLDRGKEITHLEFLTYAFVPLSVGMFPHLFQHWLTAKSAQAFKLTVIGHPICIALLWLPCIMLGIWATSAVMPGTETLVVPPTMDQNAVLGVMVRKLTNPLVAGILGAGILAAIMSSLDSQFFCLGTMFTNDIITHYFGEKRFNDKQRVLLARGFIVGIVTVTYLISLFENPSVFKLGVWCFTGFACLFPIVFAGIYWPRATKVGAMGSIAVTVISFMLLFPTSDAVLSGTVEESNGLIRAIASVSQNSHGEYLFLGVMPVAVIFTLSALAMVIGSLMTSPPSESTRAKFFAS